MIAFLKKRRLCWLLVVMVVILPAGGALLYWHNHSSLSYFVDMDLRNLDDSQQSAFGKMLGSFLPDHFPGPRTKWNLLLGQILPKELTSKRDEFWYAWRNKTKTHAGFILFQVAAENPVATFHFLAADGKYQGKSECSTRWPIEAAAQVENDLGGSPVIEIKIVGAVGRQIYGILENRVALLRIEDHAGKMVQNSYWYLPHQLGPLLPNRTREEWEELLNSSDRTQVLEGLTWIGGYHRRKPRIG